MYSIYSKQNSAYAFWKKNIYVWLPYLCGHSNLFQQSWECNKFWIVFVATQICTHHFICTTAMASSFQTSILKRRKSDFLMYLVMHKRHIYFKSMWYFWMMVCFWTAFVQLFSLAIILQHVCSCHFITCVSTFVFLCCMFIRQI